MDAVCVKGIGLASTKLRMHCTVSPDLFIYCHRSTQSGIAEEASTIITHETNKVTFCLELVDFEKRMSYCSRCFRSQC